MILDSQCPTGIGEVQISHSLLAHPNTADSGLLASHSLWGTDATAEFRDLGNSDIWIDRYMDAKTLSTCSDTKRTGPATERGTVVIVSNTYFNHSMKTLSQYYRIASCLCCSPSSVKDPSQHSACVDTFLPFYHKPQPSSPNKVQISPR